MTSATLRRPWPTVTTIAPPAASRYVRPSDAWSVLPSPRSTTGSARPKTRGKAWPAGPAGGVRDSLMAAIVRGARRAGRVGAMCGPPARGTERHARRPGRPAGRRSRASDAAPRDRVPVGLVEDHLAQVPELVRLGRPGWVLVVELEERALAVTDLEEAHHLAGVTRVLPLRFAPHDQRADALRDDRRLEVGGGAGLRERQGGRDAEGVDVRVPRDLRVGRVRGNEVLDLERVAVGREPARLRREARVDHGLDALVRRDADQQVVGILLHRVGDHDRALRVDRVDAG